MKQPNNPAAELAAIRKQLNRAKSHRRLALQRRVERLELKALQQEIGNDGTTETTQERR